jgi:hypothetical protein
MHYARRRHHPARQQHDRDPMRANQQPRQQPKTGQSDGDRHGVPPKAHDRERLLWLLHHHLHRAYNIID